MGPWGLVYFAEEQDEPKAWCGPVRAAGVPVSRCEVCQVGMWVSSGRGHCCLPLPGYPAGCGRVWWEIAIQVAGRQGRRLSSLDMERVLSRCREREGLGGTGVALFGGLLDGCLTSALLRPFLGPAPQRKCLRSTPCVPVSTGVHPSGQEAVDPSLPGDQANLL